MQVWSDMQVSSPQRGSCNCNTYTFECSRLPIANEKECAYYLRTGQCEFASTCKFHRPQPSNTVVALRVSIYSPGQSATSPGQHTYPGAVNNWTMSRSASFIASPRWPGHSGYAQVIVPQGLVQVSGWNPYAAQMGSSSPDDQQ
uniref:C3H1-type domain-containing protein n=1 Tax=Arundo donax TaxID=35708 RepID=A0A0A9CH13_ARUDO